MVSQKKLYAWFCLKQQQPSDNGFTNSFEYRTISEQFKGADISAKPNGLLELKLNPKAGLNHHHHNPPPTTNNFSEATRHSSRLKYAI